jgi:hypothetical protein
MPDELSKSDFAKLAGVSPGRISQLLRDGVISRSALIGEGRNAKINPDLALAMMRDRTDPARRATNLVGTDSAASSFLANRARREGYAADLLALRLGQGRRQLEEEYKAALATVMAAIKRAHRALPFEVEEIIEAWHGGGLPAAYAKMRSKTDELLASIWDMILAAQDGRSPEGDGDGD